MRPAFVGMFCSAVALVSLGLAATIASGGTGASAPARAGISYGALTSQAETVWIRLRPDRKRIASLEAGWEAPASRCTNHRPFYSFSYTGGENGRIVPVRSGGFRTQLTDRYFEGGTAIVERFEVAGRIDAAKAVGQFTAKVTAVRPDGSSYRCSLGPIRFRAVN
jgi:hypothetical protein